MSIGNVITELRSERDLSQKKLADAIGVSQSTIAQIEVNRNEATASTLRKLADFFEVTTDYLLEREDDFGVRMTPSVAPMGDTFTAEERQLIEKYRRLNPACKKLINNTIDTLVTTSAAATEQKRKNS